jgi:hypothetical protein
MVLQVRITFKSRRYSVERPQHWRSVSYAVGAAARTNGFANSRKLLHRRGGRDLDLFAERTCMCRRRARAAAVDPTWPGVASGMALGRCIKDSYKSAMLQA